MNAKHFQSSYADISGIRMYYEVHGEGFPIVLLHGGGSTLHTSFGKLIPLLSRNRKVIAMDLQAHGRTSDRTTGLSFEQDADDVAALLQQLQIEKADFLGFSNGGQTLFEMALRHPALINKLIMASAFYKRDAVAPQFWEGFSSATLDMMPIALRKAFLEVNNNEAALLNMFNRDVQRMKNFKGWSDEQLRSIKAPVLILNGNDDVASVEHAVEMHRNLSNSQLAILPGKHGDYLGTLEMLENGVWRQQYVAELLEAFLEQ